MAAEPPTGDKASGSNQGKDDPPADASTAAPNFRRLLAIAGPPESDEDGIDGLLARCYGLARQHDWPLAPVLLSALGVKDDGRYCLVADPVSLVASHNDVRLAGIVDDVSADEAAALVTALNAHFADDGLFFLAARPERWFVRSRDLQHVTTHPVSVATGRSLRALLPSGPDAGKWRRWQDEIQMLLHQHPVNADREAHGLRPISGVWFWGGGTAPVAEPRSIVTWADRGMALALAAYVGMPVESLPPQLGPVLTRDCETAVVAFDLSASSADIDRAWFKPAWTALTRGDVAAVSLITDGESAGTMFTANHPTLWQRLTLPFRQRDAPTMTGAH